MSMVLNEFFALLLAYRYPILLPFSVIEGPIATVVGGFLVSLGLMDPFIVYAVVVAGDIIGDAMLYFAGYWGGGYILKYGSRFGVTREKMDQAEDYFKGNHRKAVVLSKLFHGVGFTGLLAAGSLKIPYKHYFQTCTFITIIQSMFFLVIGIFFGGAYVSIAKYLNYFAAFLAITVLAIIITIFYKRTGVKKIEKKIKDYEQFQG